MIQCPYCNHQIEIRGAKPGRFTPKCTRCGKRFMLLIPPERENAPPQVSPLKEAEVASPGAAASGTATTAGTVARTAAPAGATAPPAQRASRQTVAPSAAVAAPGGAAAPAQDEDLTGATLGGYQVKEKLGQGGMGTVYLARQISLDRDVAVKVMNPAWAKDPQFVVRFTREAYAAAQLTHHNVVQIHDIGADDDIHFFSMEFVPGRNLGALVARDGKQDGRAAAGYVLQAARGLQFAHDQGMIHRDIKPENLLLNEQGIVKVADLGLVKTPGDREVGPLGGAAGPGDFKTQVNVSMGTPAYMAPEQARNAAAADGRSDVYSLGCTLYALVTGQPPYTGKTAMEVISKHQSEALVPPEMIARRVPGELSAIIQKMTAKAPEDRYQNMAQVIKALEGFLGVDSSGPFSPKEEHVTALEESVKRFNSAGWAALRRYAIWGFYALCLVATIVTAVQGQWQVAGEVLGVGVLTFLSYLVVTGLTQKTLVFVKLRELIFGASLLDWAKGIGIVLGVGALLWFFGLLWVWLGICVAAAALAAGFHFTIDRLAAAQRQPAVDDALQLLRNMRLRGLEENALRQFVCNYSGERWEEFYEALFGYEAKMQARELWGRGEQGKMRRKYGTWRDGVVAWVDRIGRGRRAARDRKLLEKLEEKSLEAAGMAATEAREKAQDQANAMMNHAAEVRASVLMRAAITAAPGAAAVNAVAHQRALQGEDVKPKREADRVRAARTFGGNIGLLLLGPRPRFILGAVLMGICFAWLSQNDLLQAKKWEEIGHNAVENAYNTAAKPGEKALPAKVPQTNFQAAKAVELPLVSRAVAETYLSSPVVGFAGLLLVLSALRPGAKMGLFMFPAAVLIVVGRPWFGSTLGLPASGMLSAAVVASAAGFGVAVVGYLFGKE